MKKIILLPILILALAVTASAATIKIAKKDLPHFVGTYDAAQGTFTDYKVLAWDDEDPMGYSNAVSQLPDKKDTYFCVAPWYLRMAEAIYPYPDENTIYAAMVDVRSLNTQKAILTKWKTVGDDIELVCTGDNFPELGGPPNIDGIFTFPDSSHFLVVRSAGGDDTKIWRKYGFYLDEGNCKWLKVYLVESATMPFAEEFYEYMPTMVPGSGPEYTVKTYFRKYAAIEGGKNYDGSYSHQPGPSDSSFVNLWELAQKARAGN